MKTPYGELNKGDIYVAADGSRHQLTVVDVDTHADVQDALVCDKSGVLYRIDWFKLMMVRYKRLVE